MEAKSFAVGVRIEHPQKMITEDQYGPEAPDFLGAAPYKLTNQCENGEVCTHSACVPAAMLSTHPRKRNAPASTV